MGAINPSPPAGVAAKAEFPILQHSKREEEETILISTEIRPRGGLNCQRCTVLGKKKRLNNHPEVITERTPKPTAALASKMDRNARGANRAKSSFIKEVEKNPLDKVIESSSLSPGPV